MKQSCELSNVAKKYLETFSCILEDMIRGMTSAKLTDSISYNFMVQMIPHHRAAIEMSQNLLRYTTCIPLQDIALGIVEEQTKSIADMEKILCACGRQKNAGQDLCRFQKRMNQIMETMFLHMRDAYGDNRLNADFMREMIPHHRGAVEMSQNTLEYNICPGLIPVLNAIIASQERGIRQMEKLLRILENHCSLNYD